MSYRDVTKKFKIQDTQSWIDKASKLNIPFIGLDEQVDTYFETHKGKLKWRKGSIENLITHYDRNSRNGVEETIVYRYEINPDIKAIQTLAVTHKKVGQITKKRYIFKSQEVKIHIDLLESGASYLEVEVFDQNKSTSLNQLKATCESWCADLGLTALDQIPTGYLSQND